MLLRIAIVLATFTLFACGSSSPDGPTFTNHDGAGDGDDDSDEDVDNTDVDDDGPETSDPITRHNIVIAPPQKGAAPADASMAILFGTVVDADHGEPLAGVTIVAVNPSEDVPYSEITDAGGQYSVPVPAGDYEVTFYYADITVQATRATLQARMTTTTSVTLDTAVVGGDMVIIRTEPRERRRDCR